MKFSFSQELPQEFKRLKDKRDAEVEKIEGLYVSALKNLKIKYTKKGDLDSAILVDEEIKAYERSRQLDSYEEFLGTWRFDFGDWVRVRTFKDNGKVFQNGRAWGIWKVENSKLVIKSDDGKQINEFRLPVKDGEVYGTILLVDDNKKGKVKLEFVSK